MTHWDLLSLSATHAIQNRTESEWRETVANLETHCLAGYVYSLKNPVLPEDVAEELKFCWTKTARRNFLYLDEVHAIGKTAAREGLRPVLLKGAALLQDVYDDPGERAMSDVDVLMEPEKLDPFLAILRNRGFVELSCKKWEANDFKIVMTKIAGDSEIPLEIHSRLFYGEPEKFKWEHVPSSIEGYSVLTPEHALVHMAGHAAYQHTFSSLNWLVDMDLFLRKHRELSWTHTIETAARLGKINSLAATLFCLRKYFGTNVPESVAKTFDTASRKIMSSFLTGEFLWNPWEKKFHYYALKHLLKDSIKEALRYDYLWVRRGIWIRNDAGLN